MRKQTKLVLSGCALAALAWLALGWPRPAPAIAPAAVGAPALDPRPPARSATLVDEADARGAPPDAPARTPLVDAAVADPRATAPDEAALRVVRVVDPRGRALPDAAVLRVDRPAPTPLESTIRVAADGSFDLEQILGVAAAQGGGARREVISLRLSAQNLTWGADGSAEGDLGRLLRVSFGNFEPADDGTPPRLLLLGTTDASGRCRVSLPVGSVLVATTQAEGSSGLVDADDGRAQVDGEIVLVAYPPCVVRGIVVDAAGRALPDATVAARASGARGPARGRSVADVATDAGGAFVLSLDAVAHFDLQAKRGEHASETLRLDARASAGETVRIRMLDAIEVRGAVRDPRGQPAAKAQVRLRRAEPDPGADPFATPFDGTVTTDDDGAFRLLAPGAGRYVATASRDDHAPSAPTPVAVGAADSTPSVHLHLRTWAAMSGTVRWDDGTPIAGATLTARPEPGQGADDLAPDRVETGADGNFALPHLLAHLRYELTCVPLAAVPDAREVRAGVTPSAQAFVFARAALQGVPVRVRLVVPEGVRHESASAIVSRRLPSGWRRGPAQQLAFDADHVATVDHLQEGETYVIELRGSYSRCRTEPFVAGRDAEHALVAKAPGKVTVHVCEADGSPALEATAILREDAPEGLRRDDATMETDLRGRAHWESVSALPWFVLAARDGREAAPVRVQVEPGGNHVVEVRLR